PCSACRAQFDCHHHGTDSNRTQLVRRAEAAGSDKVMPLTPGTVETFNNFIHGRWTASRGGATFGDENPAHRGSNLGAFQSSAVDDVRHAIDAAADAFRAWRRTSVADRQRSIAAFLNLL